MRAFIVCVDFSDILAYTLPINRDHFSEIIVITTPEDERTREVCEKLGSSFNLVLTKSFYRDGASFNKYRALEEAYDAYGRDGWICNLDADIVIPSVFNLSTDYEPICKIGNLYTPKRRMMRDLSSLKENGVPKDWSSYPIHPQAREWAGYCQIFHGSDRQLVKTPWHEINWKHAGGGDSEFQNKWPVAFKYRPSWEVLHLGDCWQNWFGRATPMLDGSMIEESEVRADMMKEMLMQRMANRDYRAEKIQIVK